jgi:hypothetical protein
VKISPENLYNISSIFLRLSIVQIYMIDLKMVTDATGKIMDTARKGNRK